MEYRLIYKKSDIKLYSSYREDYRLNFKTISVKLYYHLQEKEKRKYGDLGLEIIILNEEDDIDKDIN